MSDWDQSSRSFEGTWEKLSQVAVQGAEHDSPERLPHPKCLDGTRVDLRKYIHGLLDKGERSQIIWLHGTAGVGKSAVAFTVAEKMRTLKKTERMNVETRLAGTFFFSRKHTKRSTPGHFFATLAYQLASNFPSVQKDVNKAIRDNPAVLDPHKSLRNQMQALFRQPLWHLRFRLGECLPPVFVIDALDECEPKAVADLISLLGEALRDPELPVVHILLTSRSEEHIRKAMQTEDMRPLVCEIPVNTSGEGVAATISLDGADVDNDIYIFLQHSFQELQGRHPDFPQPSRDELAKLASRAGRRFIVATTMINFINDRDNDPRDRLQLMLELTNDLLPGTEVHRLYDHILSTCADPQRAHLYLSVVAALADPLPISQISKLLGPGRGNDVETVLLQLRSVIDIPTDGSLPVNIYHSSVRDYVSDPSNCSLNRVQSITSIHSLLAHSCLHLMIHDMPASTLLDALSELKGHNQAIQAHDPWDLQQSLAFMVQPPEPLHVLESLLWLRGCRGSGLRSWLGTLDGRAWLQTAGGSDWLQTREGEDWLSTRRGEDWLQTRGGKAWLETDSGRGWLQTGRGWLWTWRLRERAGDPDETKWQEIQMEDWLKTQSGRDWLKTQGGRNWLHAQSGYRWLRSQSGRDWLQTPSAHDWLDAGHAQDWLQTWSGQDWLQTQSGREWLQTRSGREWIETRNGERWLCTGGREWVWVWLQNSTGIKWLQTSTGRMWLQTYTGREWLLTLHGHEWLDTSRGQEWLHTSRGQEWLVRAWNENQDTLRRRQGLQTLAEQWQLQTLEGRKWLLSPDGREWLHTLQGCEWSQTPDGQEWMDTWDGRRFLQTQSGKKWLQTSSGHNWLQTSLGHQWLQTSSGHQWLQTSSGHQWLQTSSGHQWLQTSSVQEWLQTQNGCEWLQTQSGQEWLQTRSAREWLLTSSVGKWLRTWHGREWLQTQSGREWLQTRSGREWLQTQSGRDWLQTPNGQAWQSTPAASVWLTMEHFSSTWNAISDCVIIPDLPSVPAFQAIQEFRSLPDFLMFPVSLALRPPIHFTSTLPQSHLLPDMEIIHAMTAFAIFANEARERSRSASDACKYACQNWAFHLSRAPNSWDNRLEHTFKVFWNRHLLSWLETQWCLKGLQSCLGVLCEGQTLAKEHLF